MDESDLLDTGLDIARLKIQRNLNNYFSEKLIKHSSKTSTNLASNSGASQTIITLNTKPTVKLAENVASKNIKQTFLTTAKNSIAKDALNLAKTNLISGLVSFGVGTVIDCAKGTSLREAVISNAKSSVGSAVGGFLGGLIGSAVPIIGTGIGSAVGSVLGSLFASWF